MCSISNFATRNTCRACGTARSIVASKLPSAAPAAAVVVKPGDWTCAECAAHNFATRRVCRQCGGARVAVGASVRECVVCMDESLELVVFAPVGPSVLGARSADMTTSLCVRACVRASRA